MTAVLNQRDQEIEITPVKDASILDEVLKQLWEKARATSTVLNQLRTENTTLSDRLLQLEREITSLKSDISKKDYEIKQMRMEYTQLTNSAEDNVLSTEDRENLKSKIRDLIAKINSHL